MSISAGSILGHYEIVALLGAGGMGEVYRAKDPRLKREVAIKILPAEVVGDPEREMRFRQEAQAASGLNHPNIITVHDVGNENGMSYIVSELVIGESLRKEIQHGPMPAKKLLEIATQIADGLAAAHQAGIIHRDLKPENIMMNDESRIKILDFGLAKLQPASGEAKTLSLGVTEAGMVRGTPAYMSPEQASGHAVDFHSDQFSFGSILYEMASGNRAFAHNTAAQTMASIISEEPPLLSGANPKIPAPVRWLIERCMAKEPRQRYDSTTDLYRELRTLRDHLSETTQTVQLPAPRKQSIAKRILVPVLFLVAIAASFLVSRLLSSPPSTDLSSYRFTAFATDPAYEDQAEWSPDGKTLAFVRTVNGIAQIFTQGISASTPTQLTKSPSDCWGPFWSPDQTRIYFSRFDPEPGLWRIGAAGGSPEKIIQNVALMGATISPDQKAIVFARREMMGGAISLWISAPPGSTPKPFPGLPQGIYAGGEIHFAPDGSKIGIYLRPLSGKSNNLNEFWIMPFPSGPPVEVKALAGKIGLTFGGYCWMPDSRRIVFHGPIQGADVHLWMADTESAAIHPITASTNVESSPSVSPNGNKIAFTLGAENYDLVEIPLDGSPVKNLFATSQNESDAAWSPSGTQYAYITDRTGAREIWLKSPGEGWDRPLLTAKDFEDTTIDLYGPSFSPDGQRIAYERYGSKGESAVWISNVAGGTPVRLVMGEEACGFGGVSWSPDGEWITWVHGEKGKFALTKARVGQGQPVMLKPASFNINYHPQWSPDGRWITFYSREGLLLVSADGKSSRLVSPVNSIIQTWSRDGKTIYELKPTPTSWQVVAFDLDTNAEKVLGEIEDFWDVRGASLAPDGKSIATSISRVNQDIWILEGFSK